MPSSTPVATMKGSVLGVILHDVCDEIRLEQLRDILGARRVEPSFKHATPDYVRFENPPVVEQLEAVALASGETLIPQIKYYDYGVISVLFELAFEADWETLVQLAARWVPNPDWSARRSRSFAAGWSVSRPPWCVPTAIGSAKTITFSP